MSSRKKTDEVHFEQGYRRQAIKVALDLIREQGRGAEIVICRDVPGPHTGGEDCFCGPKVLQIYPEDL